ncbi:MAG TPA: Ig-like domain-containing protein, partial [Candidatus Baltobacteraceae bacterium]|nr:Ig-like domain-containing protein [Candidatus Baltobacteraceae bacterium]
MRRHIVGFVSLAAVCVVVACGRTPSAPTLVPVAALPVPSLPPWIASISPTDKADTLAQIRVVFAKPVTAVEQLSGPGPREVLDHISIVPALAGHFAVLTPRMIGFVPDRALPIGTRVQVTISAGLRDLEGDVLAHDVAWTFATAPLELRDLPQLQPTDEGTPAPVGLRPTLQVTANAAVDAETLANNATLSGGGDSVDLTATLHATPTPYPGSNAEELFDPSISTWVYDLKPTRDLRGGTEYTLKIDSGVRPSYGNLATAKTYQGGVSTYGPLGIVPTPKPSPNSGSRFSDGDPAIAFTNPIDPKSIVGAVTVSPGPAKIAVSLGGDVSNVVSIDPYALDPDKTYVATVAAGVKDIFGQTLGQDQKVTFHTSDFAPGAWSPSGLTIIPAGTPIALNFYATNLPGNRYQAAYARYPAVKMLDSTDALGALPSPKSWPSRTLAGARTNQQSVVRVPLAKELAGPFGALAYGFRTALDSPDSSPGLTGIVQLTNLGVFAQWFPLHGTVLVQHLNDGAPVRSAAVAVYRIDESNKTRPQQCASGTTDAGGKVDFRGVEVERCSALASSNQAPSLGFVVTSGADMASLTVWSWSGISRFDVTGGWTSGAPLSRGTVLTDRQMYQPGERGELTGIAYYVSGERVVADAKAKYTVKLVDPNNNSTKLGTVQTDAFGVFSMPITFSKQQALGYYTVDAKGANGNDIGGSLRVAEFKPPNFKLTLSLNAKSAQAGSSVAAQVAAAYLFGAPLQGGTAHAYVTRDVATVAPKGWDDYWFGRQ